MHGLEEGAADIDGAGDGAGDGLDDGTGDGAGDGAGDGLDDGTGEGEDDEAVGIEVGACVAWHKLSSGKS